MNKGHFLTALALGLGMASPALAAGGFSIPEPSDLALLGMGLAGLIIGRQVARKRPEDQD
ncbi:PEP-CTERM sorting domain-containing protein [Novosphingobium sp.]|uniref:PEP-CTERM sorting domain-containing protein n=1 Tax=Novosphingobium sp. TaxID=1874826 RepID=UPI0025E18943|nr:PEP-CTERM sorting domain-containing protein [Novosphingobium sp.]MCC6926610.1 PEP-CTERM sorting domain-containing protein [Novosphingobium sp.]